MYEMTGASDYLLRVVASDVASYEAFLRGRLTHIPGVQSFESALALKRLIYRTNLPLRQGAPSRAPRGWSSTAMALDMTRTQRRR